MRVLHITNGDAAVPRLRAAQAEGDILPWREVLHDGPVPPGLDPAALRAVRARFIAERAPFSEAVVLADMEARDRRLEVALAAGEPVLLWFEADLYDVLLLVQILARLPDGAPVRLVLVGQEAWTSVTAVAPDELARLGREAPLVSPAQLALARSAWAAFTAERPRALEPVAAGTPALPAVGQAFRRLLEELPWTGSGLSLTEQRLLGALAAGARSREEAFRTANAEERPFLGDATAWDTLDRLAPLLDGDRVNERGRAVLAGAEEWRPAEERWIGGVRLPPGRPPYYWDPVAERVAVAA